MDSIAENLANSAVPGYKRVNISHKPFDTLFNEAKGRVANEDADPFDPLVVDFSQGPLRATGRPLDFALDGKGFFVVTKDDKE